MHPVGTVYQYTNIVYGYLLAVFVRWLVVIHWNSSLKFTLHQSITIVSHELREYKSENRVNDTNGAVSDMSDSVQQE